MLNLEERRVRTEAVVAKFRARRLDWRKAATCVHLARAQMRAMGHRPPSIPQFYSPRGALTAMRKAGFADLSAMLDSMLPRIAPAEMWVGDLALVSGTPPFDSIMINAGLGKLLGYAEAEPERGIVNFVPTAPLLGAWRL